MSLLTTKLPTSTLPPRDGPSQHLAWVVMNNRKMGEVERGGVSLHSTTQASGAQNRSSGVGLVRSIWRGEGEREGICS